MRIDNQLTKLAHYGLAFYIPLLIILLLVKGTDYVNEKFKGLHLSRKSLAFIALFTFLFICVGVIATTTITTLEPGTLTAENITFGSAGSNDSLYFSILNGSYIVSATMNVSGFEGGWRNSSDITSGLSIDDSENVIPTATFYKDSTWYLIAGTWNGPFYGYNWSGSTWQSYDPIVSGLTAKGTRLTPTVFNKSSTWYMIVGNNSGDFAGYNWSGSTWQSYDPIVSGLPSGSGTSTFGAPEVFNKSGTLYMIVGNWTGDFAGYNWSGSTWQSYDPIVSGLSSWAQSVPTVFNKSGTLYLISGDFDGDFWGYNWSGSTWQSDLNINESLGDIGTGSSPEVFNLNGRWYLIAGESVGDFYGYIYDDYPSNVSIDILLEEDAEDSWAYELMTNPSNSVDEDLSTYATADNSGRIFENYTIPTTINTANWRYKVGFPIYYAIGGHVARRNLTADCYNYTSTSWINFSYIESHTTTSSTHTIKDSVPSDCLSNILQIRSTINGTSETYYYEGNVTWGGEEFELDGELNSSNSPTNFTHTNFTTSLQNYLDYICLTSTCSIYLNVSSDTAGIVMLDAISIVSNTGPPVINENYTIPNLLNYSEDYFNITVNVSDADAGENMTYVNLTIRSPDGNIQVPSTNMTYIANDIWNYTTSFTVNQTGYWNFTVNASDGTNITRVSWLKGIFLDNITVKPKTYYYYLKSGVATQTSWNITLTHNATETINYTFSYEGFLVPSLKNTTVNISNPTTNYIANRTQVGIGEVKQINITITHNASLDLGTYYGNLTISREEGGDVIVEKVEIIATFSLNASEIQILDPSNKKYTGAMYNTGMLSWTPPQINMIANGNENLIKCNVTADSDISSFTTFSNFTKGDSTNFNLSNSSTKRIGVTFTTPSVGTYDNNPITIICTGEYSGAVTMAFIDVNLVVLSAPVQPPQEGGGSTGGKKKDCNITLSPEKSFLSSIDTADRIKIINNEKISISPTFVSIGDLSNYLIIKELPSNIAGDGGEGSFVIQAVNYEEINEVLTGEIIITPSATCKDINISVSFGEGGDAFSKFLIESGGVYGLLKSKIGDSEASYWLLFLIIFMIFMLIILALWRRKKISFKLKRTIVIYICIGFGIALLLTLFIAYIIITYI